MLVGIKNVSKLIGISIIACSITYMLLDRCDIVKIHMSALFDNGE